MTIPSSDPIEIMKVATACLKKIFKEGYGYHKVGICLGDITQEANIRHSLFQKEDNIKGRTPLIEEVDKINQKYGRNTIYFAGEGSNKQSPSPARNISPCYTTKWTDLLGVL
jgi:DNA polymerase V